MSGLQPDFPPLDEGAPRAAAARGESVSSAPYQGAAMGPPASTAVVADLQERLVQLAEERGSIRAQINPDPLALQDVDRRFDAAISEALTIAPCDTPGYDTVYRVAKEAHDEMRLEAVEKLLRESSLRCGLAQGRDFDAEAVRTERTFIAAYREAQKDLFSHYPDLNRRVDALLDMEEKRGIRMRLDADKIAITISIALRRFMPDAKTVIEALSGKRAHELELIKDAFKSRYNLDLAAFIRQAFDRPGLRYLLPTQAIVDRAADLLEGKKCPSDVVYTSHPARLAKEFLQAAFPARAELAKLESSNTLENRALQLGHALDAGPKKAHRVFEILERVGRDRLQALQLEYSECFAGENLDEAIDAMPPSYSKDRAQAFLNDDTARYNAALIGCCIQRIGKASLISFLEDYHVQGRRDLIANFEKVYKADFWEAVERKLRKADVSYLRALYESDDVPKAERIWHSVDGPGTDEHGIRSTLNGMTRAQIVQLEAEYFELSRGRTWTGRPEHMEQRLRWETSGDAWHDIERLLKGVPEDVHAMHDRLMECYAHERSGSWIRRVDAFTREGEVMDREVGAAHEYYEKNIRDKSPSPDVVRRFETMVRFCNRDMIGFRMTKNDWSDFVANTSSAVAAIASVLPLAHLTSGIPRAYVHAAVVALGAGIIQGGVQFFLKVKLKGDGFGREEKVRDISLSALRAGSFYLSKFLPISVLRRPIDIGTKMGLKTIIRLGETSDVQRTPAHALTLRDLRRALDEDSSSESVSEADGELSDEVGTLGRSCSTSHQDIPFERSLRRLFGD